MNLSPLPPHSAFFFFFLLSEFCCTIDRIELCASCAMSCFKYLVNIINP
uniref:Uncharacterized protein LOC103449524 isoform X3 n=1 Tax=Rhizophora mucronata TaxID=61149 RepID=A0A2P2L4T0_RHIMU